MDTERKRTRSTAAPRKKAFQFITVSHPDAIKERQNQRLLRGHAITSSLQHHRQSQSASGDNFVLQSGTKPQAHPRRRITPGADAVSPVPRSPRAPGGTSIDPFETLPIDASRLTALLRLKTSRSATEPIIALGDILQAGGLRSMFNVGFEDPALTAALGLALSSAASKGNLSVESLTFRAKAITALRRRVEDAIPAQPAPVVGATLLLLGTEYRLGNVYGNRAHLDGLRALLGPNMARAYLLPDSLRRAIFWQDLFASLIQGTTRITSYDLYPTEYHIGFVQSHKRTAPPGFVASREVLGEDFLAVTADISGLHSICKLWSSRGPTHEELNQVDGLQAWIESRLLDLRLNSGNMILTPCILAAFLCTYGCWDGVWNSALLPEVLTRQLLENLLSEDLQVPWHGHWELLCWCICVGIAFAQEHEVREGLAALKIPTPSMVVTMDLLLPESVAMILERFIWLEVKYDADKEYFFKLIKNNTPSSLDERPTVQRGNTTQSDGDPIL